MKRGQYLSPDEVHIGQAVIVVPSGEDVARGVDLGAYSKGGSEARLTDALHAAARRGAVHLFETPATVEAREKAEAEAKAAEQPAAPPEPEPPSAEPPAAAPPATDNTHEEP